MPKVSVVIPAYNAMGYLPETLASALNQTFVDYEVIIVDDGSKDNIQQWAAQLSDPRVKLISQENQGLSGARNTGIAHAQGEYVAFLDADDLWAPTKLEKQVQLLEQDPDVGLVYTWSDLIDQHSKPLGRVLRSNAEGNVWTELIKQNFVANGSTPMVRRHCFETVGLFDVALRSAEDHDMWLRMAPHYSFAVVREPLTQYRILDNSLSKNLLVMERSAFVPLERAFASPPSDIDRHELETLKRQAYGSRYLLLSWYAIKSRSRDYQAAIRYCKQALQHNPKLRFSKSYARLIITIAIIQRLGASQYDRLLSLLYLLRQRFLSTASK
ncbi:glycosyltransferase family 2 protein [Microcoleus sp. FACHB-1515]|uniref:glycosyltransferase family 2 protein n=1 Tax=Cyanophyceae TaxID=3028117 RepID=UPI001683D334|nr:glycosyltransferase family A protein [Microcoleus sp. FACHB-1515]MBD2089098.1 glycosyltransferase family 2 protein [Microcoleus sp. FACHB-1515]